LKPVDAGRRPSILRHDEPRAEAVMASERGQVRKVKVWDVPTRLFHWVLALGILAAYLSHEFSTIERHMQIGYVVLTLVVFRLIWGVVGSQTSRFADFVPTPQATLAYVRASLGGRPPKTVGHNPLGSILIYVMLILVAFQAGTGLFANDAIFSEGPLAKLVSDDTSDLLTDWHEQSFWILVGCIAVHVTANVVNELVLREPLIRAMITGNKPLPADTPAPRLRPAWWAVPAVAVAAGVVWYVVTQL
jgi:cytochrome b